MGVLFFKNKIFFLFFKERRENVLELCCVGGVEEI